MLGNDGALESTGSQDPSRSDAPSALALQTEMQRVAEKALATDLREFEAGEPAKAWRELRPAVAELVQAAQSIATLVARESGRFVNPGGARLSHPFAQFEHAIDAAVITAQIRRGTPQDVEDVAFMVQMELRQREERLARLSADADLVTVIGECESALRRIPKGLGAIDIALARMASIPRRLNFSSELDVSLRVRRAYARFRRRILAGGSPSPASLRNALRSAGTNIAILVGRSEYPLFRVRDRLQLRELQARVIDWLRPERADPTEGLRVWQDLAGWVEMLSIVNRRQELVEHDTRLLAELRRTLDPETAPACDAETLARTATLAGLDPTLDEFLASPGPHGTAVLQQLLAPLAARLATGTGQFTR